MLAKRTGTNQLTFLEEAEAVFGGIEYFDVTKKNGCIVLTTGLHLSGGRGKGEAGPDRDHRG